MDTNFDTETYFRLYLDFGYGENINGKSNITWTGTVCCIVIEFRSYFSMVDAHLSLNFISQIILNCFSDRPSYESILVLLVCCTILYLSRGSKIASSNGLAF